MQGKLDVADLVQETFLDVHRGIGQFRGGSEAQFLAWLRQILVGILANQVRRYFGTKRRDVRLERQLQDDLDRSSRHSGADLIAAQSSPSAQASRREQAVLLADAIGELPEDYREVIILRQLEGMSFPQVAETNGTYRRQREEPLGSSPGPAAAIAGGARWTLSLRRGPEHWSRGLPGVAVRARTRVGHSAIAARAASRTMIPALCRRSKSIWRPANEANAPDRTDSWSEHGRSRRSWLSAWKALIACRRAMHHFDVADLDDTGLFQPAAYARAAPCQLG